MQELYYPKEGEPMNGKVPKWQNKHHWCRLLGPSDHFTNGRQCWMS